MPSWSPRSWLTGCTWRTFPFTSPVPTGWSTLWWTCRRRKPGGVGLDVIAEISKTLSDTLDNDPSTDSRPYELEVSSPGVGRPLTEERHWYRARGRMVKVNVLQGENVTGRVQSVDDDGVTLVPEITVKKGMKPKQGEPIKLPFDRIRSGKVEIEFSRLEEAGLENANNGPSEEA